jgi:hypothetical protein
MAAMEAVEEVAFAISCLADHRQHDRMLWLVTDGESWGVRSELSRGNPGPWSSIRLFANETEARAAFAALIALYGENPTWTRLD